MTFPSKTLAALIVTAGVPLLAGQAAAAPIGQSLALSNVETSQIEQVQWRRRGRWVGPAIGGFAAGAIVGSALAPRYYYDEPYAAYGYAPGRYTYAPAYGYGYAPGYYNYGYRRGCTGEESYNSANAWC